MKKDEFVAEIKALFIQYFSNKYQKSDHIPLTDAVAFWNYSLNSYSHVKKKLRQWNIPIYAGESLALSDFVDVTINKILQMELV